MQIQRPFVFKTGLMHRFSFALQTLRMLLSIRYHFIDKTTDRHIVDFPKRVKKLDENYRCLSSKEAIKVGS